MLSMRTYPSRPKNRALCVSGPELQLVEGQKTKWFPNTQAGQREAMAFMEICYEQAAEKKQWTDHNDTPVFGSPDEPGSFCDKFIEYETSRTLPSIGDLSMVEVREKACALRQIGEFKYEGVKLRDVKIGDVQRGVIMSDIVQKIAALGAKATVKRKWTYFKQLFDYAVACDQIKQNPCAFKNGKMPFHGNTVAHTERLNDLDEVIAKVLEHAPERYRLAMIFAAYTGLRAGEQIALTWDDIDFERKKINVDKAKKKTGLIGCPKSTRGRRKVDLPTKLALLLKKWKVNQSPAERQKHNLVFPTQFGDHASTETWRRSGLHKACKSAGVENIRWHDFRHFYASTVIFKFNTSPQKVCRAMGHHDFSFTLRQYGHWFDQLQDDSELGDQISALMGRV